MLGGPNAALGGGERGNRSNDTTKSQVIEWRCCFGIDLAQERRIVESILPKGMKWKIKVESVNMSDEEMPQEDQKEANFEARISVSGCENIDYEDFLQDFYESSEGQFNKQHADLQSGGSKVQISGVRKCIRNSDPRKRREPNIKPLEPNKRKPIKLKGIERQPGKDTKCESKLRFSVRKCRQVDDHSKCESLSINIDWCHNHRTKECLQAGAFKSVKKTVEEKFKSLFQDNNGPIEALDCYTKELKQTYSDEEFLKVTSDRSIYPDKRWVYNSFEKYVGSLYGSCDGPDAAKKVHERIEIYNRKHGRKMAKFIQMKTKSFYWFLLMN